MTEILPTPKQAEMRVGRLAVCAPSPLEGVSQRLEPAAPFARHLNRDQRPEAYQIEVNADGATLAALAPEGLLRGQATLQQLLQVESGQTYLPHCAITDWPNFRYRCASDWLLNCEINRWGYDWGDGPEAYLARIKRKLDFCFTHKINQVWFDGFGWDVNRFPGYAELVRECNRYARERGIKLTFAGYGGGYGTSYQKSELYRCGYQGETFLNRRPYPDGEVYDCCGCDGIAESRRYGTCQSNEALQEAKLAEMSRFVAAVEPGFMYIHDIDAGDLATAHAAWLQRCDNCRRRWPSDEMAHPQGQAGAFAAWFGQVCEALQPVTTGGGYDASRDLTLIFISPLYTHYYEPGQPAIWEQEVEYFRLLSELLGPRVNVQFGFREQFYRADGRKKIAHLREVLDEVGHGHGIHVIAFGGGDNYTSNDLCNVSAALAHFYEGAESVCVSNGGVHEEPVQVLNAEFLWHGSAQGYRLEPPDEISVEEVLQRLQKGTYRPAELFGPGCLFERICQRLWGFEAGTEMYRAYVAGGESGHHPVSRVWWAVTREARRLLGDQVEAEWTWESVHRTWVERLEHTEEALAHARRAAEMSDDEDVVWFARCLEVGRRFGEVVMLSARLRLADVPETRELLSERLHELEAFLQAEFEWQPTDILGGDPGCWRETLNKVLHLHGM